MDKDELKDLKDKLEHYAFLCVCTLTEKEYDFLLSKINED